MTRKSVQMILWVTVAAVFMLLLAGCNSESASTKKADTSSSVQGAASENMPEESGSEADSPEKNGGAEPAGEEQKTDKDDEQQASSGDDPPDHTKADGTAIEEPALEKGTLTLYLADATTNYQAVYVTVSEVQVCMSGNGEEGEGAPGEEGEHEEGWITVAEPGQTYNLLELVNGVMAELGTTELETGYYTMLRMILGDNPDDAENLLGFSHPYPNYIITGSGEEIALFVPSGYQTGIKLVSGFDIVAGASTELVLDFDASRSVVKAGQSGKYLLKPTIKVVDSISRADVNGAVSDPDGEGIPGAIVSAQIYDAGDADAGIDPVVEVFTSTQTGDDGNYRLYLPPGDYHIVAYKGPGEGETMAYGPGCKMLETDYNFNYTENFDLEANQTGTLSVTIEILPEQDQTVSISAWKILDCDGSTVHVELPPPLNINAQVQVETHEMVLPEGTYTILAATEEIALRQSVEIVSGETAELSFDFIGETANDGNDDDNGGDNGSED